ncbi:MAG: hypothetical protein N2376_13470 [Clostridia bacterium]|nr:hypothetical protein [Clostridia bacterium]
MNMFKKLMAILVCLSMLLVALPVSAAQAPISQADTIQPVNYSTTIVVTSAGGIYRVGFVTVEFKKDFVDPSLLPMTFNVTLTVKDGVAGINFNRDISDFRSPVHIRVDNYKGLLYDETNGVNVTVDIKKQQDVAKHFSRHAFS